MSAPVTGIQGCLCVLARTLRTWHDEKLLHSGVTSNRHVRLRNANRPFFEPFCHFRCVLREAVDSMLTVPRSFLSFHDRPCSRPCERVSLSQGAVTRLKVRRANLALLHVGGHGRILRDVLCNTAMHLLG